MVSNQLKDFKLSPNNDINTKSSETVADQDDNSKKNNKQLMIFFKMMRLIMIRIGINHNNVLKLILKINYL